MEVLCFYAGLAFFYINQRYPLLLLFCFLYFRPKLKLVVWFLAAILWAVFHQYLTSASGMPKERVIQKANLVGQIASIPNMSDEVVQFTFAATVLNGHKIDAAIALSCYNHCPVLHAGQYWRLVAKLKRPRNLGNPGAFDYVGWLNTKHIQWTGTVRKNSFQFISYSRVDLWLLQLREYFCQKMASLSQNEHTVGIIQALTLGVNHQISKSQWELFRHTGTTHLIDISGAHIALIAGGIFYLVRLLWSYSSVLCLYWPAPTAASVVVLLITLVYTLLSGFAVPAQRAFLACFFMLFRYFYHQRVFIWQAWRYALLLVLLIEPHAVLMPGFYLSFMGIAIIVSVNQRISASGYLKNFLLQLACIAGMMPLTLFWFSYGAVNAIIANLFAIPWVELWIVPLGLIIMILPNSIISQWMMLILNYSILILMTALHWIDRFSWMNLTTSLQHVTSVVALTLLPCIVLFFRIRALFVPTLIMAVLAIVPSKLNVKHGHAQIDVLDVGQGLAVVINTAHHVMLYDTGVQFYRGSDMGKMVIIPYLKSIGTKIIDSIVISHPDLDHRGGLLSIEAQFPVKRLIVDEPSFYRRGYSCHEYSNWEWDGVKFRFLPIYQLTNKNNHSCVLQVSTKSQQILLTGDIEKSAELDLVNRFHHMLKSTYLLIPHHASKTSSTSTFINEVSPQYAIVSYGFDNRYRFPHPQAIQAYHQQQIPIFNTVDCGMITISLNTSKVIEKPKCYID